ncbi:MAG: hypothetical protein JO251_20160 [Verrucomicrobia bacterium]|nr:hypothetical protein [Verrucomicrobiota bacterium]
MGKIEVHILSVFEEKGEGYTVVCEVRPDTDITSEEIWRATLPGDFRGETKTDRVWHLYYGKEPEYMPGDLISINLPR